MPMEIEMTGSTSVLTSRIPEAFASALRRAEAEFLEMPGLQITEAQAARLWGADSDICRAVLSMLVEKRFLVRTPRSTYTRAS